jgi:hypothetical protein
LEKLFTRVFLRSKTEAVDVGSLGGPGTYSIHLIAPDQSVEVKKLVIAE